MVGFSNYLVNLVDELEKSREALIRGVQWKLGISQADAEDCFQEAYVRLTRASNDNRLDPNESGRGYFCESLKNACFDFLHSRRKKLVTLEDDSFFPSVARSPFDEVVLQEDLKSYENAVALMPRSCHEAFKLYVIDGLSRGEVAQKLGLRLNAVSVRVHRAEKFLRKNISV